MYWLNVAGLGQELNIYLVCTQSLSHASTSMQGLQGFFGGPTPTSSKRPGSVMARFRYGRVTTSVWSMNTDMGSKNHRMRLGGGLMGMVWDFWLRGESATL